MYAEQVKEYSHSRVLASVGVEVNHEKPKSPSFFDKGQALDFLKAVSECYEGGMTNYEGETMISFHPTNYETFSIMSDYVSLDETTYYSINYNNGMV